ncbi:hypothetical protein AADZ86_16300 [Colwelliaceae bacterium BS250]
MKVKQIIAVMLSFTLLACGEPQTVKNTTQQQAQSESMPSAEVASELNTLAERYVKLTLLVGEHQDYYIDAYYGPAEWRDEATKLPLADLELQAATLLSDIKLAKASTDEQLRKDMLVVQTRSVEAFIKQLNGTVLSFDDESMALYDAKSPNLTEADFAKAINELDNLLVGEGNINERLDAFQAQFIIPLEKLDTVFTAAIEESRKRTKAYIELPENESFTIEYVKDKPWSGYNWYQGNSFSLIQVNTDLPIQIERAIDLASHEGYPGHHVFNSLMEKHLVNANGWVEYSVYPLYSPLSLLAEGSANYGINVAYNHVDRMAFEKDVLFPLAGLDATKAEAYYQVKEILGKLSYAGNVAAQRYLDGELNKQQTTEFLIKYALQTSGKASQRVGFIERYRAYVINYNLGKDIVKDYVQFNAGDNEEKRWQVFADLLSNPKSASMMVVR